MFIKVNIGTAVSREARWPIGIKCVDFPLKQFTLSLKEKSGVILIFSYWQQIP